MIVYAWGLWQQNIAISQIAEPGHSICYSAKWHKSKKVFFDSVNKSGNKQMLEGIHALLDEADAVCTYNGVKFDIPTLNKEFVKADMPPPSPYKQIDLLKVARRVFRFPSYGS